MSRQKIFRGSRCVASEKSVFLSLLFVRLLRLFLNILILYRHFADDQGGKADLGFQILKYE